MRARLLPAWALVLVSSLFAAASAPLLRADATYFPLSSGNFSQDWSLATLITSNDVWSGVPGIVGYLGQDIITATAVDPRTVLGVSALVNDVDVIANQSNPNTTTGGVAEFDGIPNPTIALQGSGTADAPYLLLHLDTRGRSNISVSYTLRDIDGTTDNAVQSVALQYRLGASGNFINIPAGYVADATTGPSLATFTTQVSAVLPFEAENQAQVQVRIITTNAVGSDEWVGVDDLVVTSSGGSMPGVVVTQSGGGTATAEGGVSDSYTLALATTPAGEVTIVLTANGQVEISVDGSAFATSLALSFTSTALKTVTVRAVDDAVFEDAHNGIITQAITASADSNAYPTSMPIAAVIVAIADNDIPSIPTRISEIQGSGAASTRVNATVAVSAVVTGFTTGNAGIRDGFFLQEEPNDGDGDPATSEGIFVFTNQAGPLATTVAGLAVGDVVAVVGKVAEFNGLTEISTEGSAVAAITKTGTAPLPAATIVVFPAASATAFERFEGMRVVVPETMTVTGNASLGQFGELVFSSGGVLVTPTNVVDPNDAPASGTSFAGAGNVAAVTALQAANALRTIVLDDASSRSFPDPTPFLSSADPATATRRVGDTVTGFSGILSYGFGSYRLYPSGSVSFAASNPRSATPPSVGGGLKVASFNVLNYFTTFGGSDDRGASSAAEFLRQKAKIIAALLALDADIFGLIEIQNQGGGADSETGLVDLVTALNAAAGTSGPYAILPPPVAGTGTDFIRVALVYKPARVTPVGSSFTDTNPVFQRPPLAQAFTLTGSGARFIVCVNHFKSKGSGSGSDADQGDGQGPSNFSRKAQATRLVAFLEQVKTAAGDNDVLIIGDLNAYAEEDPIDILRAAGYVDLIERFVQGQRYSYNFDDAIGYLDHALASPSLNPQVAGAVEWHINADEPAFYDYNLELNPNNPGAGSKSAAQQAINAGTPFRSSDHDPLLVGLNLDLLGGTVAPAIAVHPASQTLVLGRPAIFEVVATGIPAPVYQWRRNGLEIPGATGPTLVFSQALLINEGVYTVVVSNSAGSTTSVSAVATVIAVADAPFALTAHPTSRRAAIGGTATFTANVSGTGTLAYLWFFNGKPIDGATASALTVNPVAASSFGSYSVRVTGSGVTTYSETAILGAISSAKVSGAATEVAANVRHPNGITYDQILLQGSAAVITADPGQVSRISFVDLTDDIVQVEFSGAGSLAVSLEGATEPSLPVLYNQNVNYMKGHARLVVSGANENTHVSVFSVGRDNAVNPTLFRSGVVYDGIADMASLAIASDTGFFGGVRAANASFFSGKGLTGVHAPGVQFTGPVYAGDINAYDTATPVLLLGSSSDVRIAGGDLLQANTRFVQVSGIARLRFVAGTTSHGVLLPAQMNRGRLEQNGSEVTDLITVNP